VEASQSPTALGCMQVQRWCYPQTACVALSKAAMIGSRPWARWCCPVGCVNRRWYSDAMVPSGTLLPYPAGIIHRDAAPADRVGRLRFAVFRGASRDDDALAVRKWCRFLRCPACSERCVSGPWLSQPAPVISYLRPHSSTRPAHISQPMHPAAARHSSPASTANPRRCGVVQRLRAAYWAPNLV
jgi:hypothetical protein